MQGFLLSSRLPDFEWVLLNWKEIPFAIRNCSWMTEVARPPPGEQVQFTVHERVQWEVKAPTRSQPLSQTCWWPWETSRHLFPAHFRCLLSLKVKQGSDQGQPSFNFFPCLLMPCHLKSLEERWEGGVGWEEGGETSVKVQYIRDGGGKSGPLR